MNYFQQIINEVLASSYIVITSHKSPDGDSVGSSLGMLHFIQKIGKMCVVCHPDPAPEFLTWLDGASSILTMTQHASEIEAHFDKADLIFCLDYNGPDRVGDEMQKLLEKSTRKKVMIDHHLHPKDFTDISVSDIEASSTCEMIVELIGRSGHPSLLDAKIGTPLYLGILTDTGSFRFSSVRAKTHEVLAQLLAAGVQHHIVHEVLNDNNTLSRLQIQGYALSEKLEVLEEYGVAIISLTEEEHAQWQYQKGDTDSLPNQALSIKGMKAAMLFSERDGYIKISFRSKGKENPVNMLAAEHFEGGGHANASGGKSTLTMPETLKKIKSLIPVYFSRIGN